MRFVNHFVEVSRVWGPQNFGRSINLNLTQISCFIQFHLNQFEPFCPNWNQLEPTWSDLIQFEPVLSKWSIWFILIFFDPIWTNLNQFDPTWSDLIQFEPILSDFIQIINLIQFEPILSDLNFQQWATTTNMTKGYIEA